MCKISQHQEEIYNKISKNKTQNQSNLIKILIKQIKTSKLQT